MFLIGLDAFLYVFLTIFSKKYFLNEFGTNMWMLINSTIWLVMLLIWYAIHPESFGRPKDISKVLLKIDENKFKLIVYHILAIGNLALWLYLLKTHKYIELTSITEMMVLIFTVLLGYVMLNETINTRKKFGIIISMIGIYFIS